MNNPGPVNEYQFEYKGVVTKPDFYGADFLLELRRIVESYAPRKTNYFLEWGSGLSTLLLAEIVTERRGHLVTIDNDPPYLEAVSKAVQDQSVITALALDLIGARNNQSDPELNYSTQPLSFDRNFDFILIDGRRRLECAYSSLLLVERDSVVVLHDYRRTRYQVVHSFYDTIEAGPQFLVMRPKPELLRALEPSREKTRRSFRNAQPHLAIDGEGDHAAQLQRIIQARDEKITQLEQGLAASREELKQAASSNEMSRAQWDERSNVITAQNEVITLLRNEIAESERNNSLLSAGLTAKGEELEQITRSVGWRVLTRYGRLKYRFLLPVYRLLRLPPYGRGPKQKNG